MAQKTKEIRAGNDLLAVFAGYTIRKSRYEKSWEWVDDNGHRHESNASIKEVKYDSSWDWLIPLWSKFRKAVLSDADFYKQHSWQIDIWANNFNSAINVNGVTMAFQVLVVAVKWYYNECPVENQRHATQ